MPDPSLLAAGADAMVPVPHRVVDAHRESVDVVTLVLEADGAPIAPPSPGQFCMLYAPGVGEAPISLSGDRDDVLVHTIRRSGPVTAALVSLERGAPIGVRGPFGLGWPMPLPGDRELLVVAGGIGMAPLRPVLQRAEHDGMPRHVALAVGARQPEALLFRDDLTHWSAVGVDVAVVVDAAAPGWPGEVGVVTDVIPRLLGDPTRTVAMVCGPEIMMRVAARHLVAAGVPADQIHVSVERNMHCGVGHCGHCQLGPVLTCRDGPVLPWSRTERLLEVRRW